MCVCVCVCVCMCGVVWCLFDLTSSNICIVCGIFVHTSPLTVHLTGLSAEEYDGRGVCPLEGEESPMIFLIFPRE